jgi:CheY-like chemotaxis protein
MNGAYEENAFPTRTEKTTTWCKCLSTKIMDTNRHYPLAPARGAHVDSVQKIDADHASLLAEMEKKIKELQLSESSLRSENEGLKWHQEEQDKKLELTTSERDDLRSANTGLASCINELEVRMRNMARDGGSIQDERQDLLGKLREQIDYSQGIEREKQLVEDAFHSISAEHLELKRQLSDLEIARSRNDELNATVRELNEQITTLALQLETKQKLPRALAPAQAGNKLDADATSPLRSYSLTGTRSSGFSRLQSLLKTAAGTTPAVDCRRVENPANDRLIESIPDGNAVSKLVKVGTRVVPDTVGITLEKMRRLLSYFARHTTDLGVLKDLCHQVEFITMETAKTGILSLHQFARALQILLWEWNLTPSLINYSGLRTVGRALDFIFRLIEREHTGKLKRLSPAHILAVDDEKEVLALLAKQLGALALILHSSTDPRLVIPALNERHFDLVILDIGMPVLNGLQLCGQIRKLETHTRTPVIFLNEYTTSDLHDQTVLVGGDDFVRKPFHAAELGLKAIFWVLQGQLA